MSDNLVSIIIPAFNSNKTIASAISACQNQDYDGNVEIIIVDDGSTDNTASIIKSFKDVKYIRQDNSGPAKARNMGFKESSGEFIFFTDSDCEPEKNWIKKILACFEDSSVGVVAGSYGIKNKDNFLAMCVYKEIIYRHMALMPKYPKSFGSYNFCARRKAFAEVGGFTETYRWASGEDNDLSYKILKAGYKIYFDSKVIVRHYFPENTLKYLFEQFRHGFWRVKMYIDHPKMSFGDDYTFWKDIIEPPLVLFLICCLFGSLFYGALLNFSFAAFLFLVFIEFFYGLMITKKINEGLFFSFVMFLRSFARTLGFLSGVSKFLIKNTSKKIK